MARIVGTEPVKASAATSVPSPQPSATPTVKPDGYFIGGMDGEVCEPKSGISSGTARWYPTEELCVHAAAGAGTGSVSYSPNLQFVNVPAGDGSGDTFASRVQIVSGASYATTLVNNNSGGFGTVKFQMNSYSASDLSAAQAQPFAPSHKMYYGMFARSGSLPFGMYSPNTSTVDAQKGQDLLDAGVQMARTGYSTFFSDMTGIGGGYSFGQDDPAIAWLVKNHIVPLFEIDAGSKQYGTISNHTTQPLMHNPQEYANFCAATASHIHTTYPSIGTASMPAYFTIPLNEPNAGNWNASQSDNPSLYAETASGPALYMKACYAKLKVVFPTAMVYGGELSTAPDGNSASMKSEVTRWYAAGCRVGSCFDGVTLHISPIGDPSKTFTRCYENGDGWTFACINDVQSVATSHGDPNIHVMITETAIPSVPNANVSAGDEAGQAWWESQTLAAAAKNQYIDGIFWANMDEDALYPQPNIFYGGSLIDTSGSSERRKAAFYTFCGFAKFPAPCASRLGAITMLP